MRFRIYKFFFEIARAANPAGYKVSHFLWRYNRTTYVYYVPYREKGLRLVLAWDEPNPERIPLFRFQLRWS